MCPSIPETLETHTQPVALSNTPIWGEINGFVPKLNQLYALLHQCSGWADVTQALELPLCTSHLPCRVAQRLGTRTCGCAELPAGASLNSHR